jgi:hypothetical protein
MQLAITAVGMGLKVHFGTRWMRSSSHIDHIFSGTQQGVTRLLGFVLQLACLSECVRFDEPEQRDEPERFATVSVE